MNHPPPPLITLHLDLSDEAAETPIDLLLHIAHQLQIHSPYRSTATTIEPTSDNPTSGQTPTAVLNRHRRR